MLERDPLQSVRAIVLLICLLSPSDQSNIDGTSGAVREHALATHALKFMAALAAGMEIPYAGAVREQAMRGWQHLVRGLAAGAADMLQQV